MYVGAGMRACAEGFRASGKDAVSQIGAQVSIMNPGSTRIDASSFKGAFEIPPWLLKGGFRTEMIPSCSLSLPHLIGNNRKHFKIVGSSGEVVGNNWE